jgi:hypothetical protein
VITLPENAHAVSKVAVTAGATMFLRIAIVSRMTTMPLVAAADGFGCAAD